MALENEVYIEVAEKLGAPKSERILKLLQAYFSPEEAVLPFLLLAELSRLLLFSLLHQVLEAQPQQAFDFSLRSE